MAIPLCKDGKPVYGHKSRKSGLTYYLHAKPARNGVSKLFYFSKEEKINVEHALSEIPAGKHVVESLTTGLPLIKQDGAPTKPGAFRT